MTALRMLAMAVVMAGSAVAVAWAIGTLASQLLLGGRRRPGRSHRDWIDSDWPPPGGPTR